MRRKIKLISSLASLVLVFVVMAYSVWAAQEINISVTNSIKYTVVGDVKATISGTKAVVGTNTEIETGDGPITPVELNGSETASTGTLSIGAVVLKAINGGAAGSTIEFEYTVTVTNDAVAGEEFSHLTVIFGGITPKVYENLSYGITVTYTDTSTTVDYEDGIILAPNEAVTMTVTFVGDARVDHDTTTSGLLNSSISLVATTDPANED